LKLKNGVRARRREERRVADRVNEAALEHVTVGETAKGQGQSMVNLRGRSQSEVVHGDMDVTELGTTPDDARALGRDQPDAKYHVAAIVFMLEDELVAFALGNGQRVALPWCLGATSDLTADW
jgi:hypothetical protein